MDLYSGTFLKITPANGPSESHLDSVDETSVLFLAICFSWSSAKILDHFIFDTLIH